MKFVTISSILFSAVWADSNHPYSSKISNKLLESHDKSWIIIHSDVFLWVRKLFWQHLPNEYVHNFISKFVRNKVRKHPFY